MDKRGSERITYDQPVDFSVCILQLRELKSLNFRARGIDMNMTGICVQIDYPLEPGHVLKFKDRTAHKTGIVKWSKKADNISYRIGIKFV